MQNTVFKEIMTQNEKQSLTGDEEIIKELVSCIFFKVWCLIYLHLVGCLKFD